MKVTAFFLLLSSVPSILGASEAEDILRRSREAYTKLASYDMRFTFATRTAADGFKTDVDFRLSLAAQQPDKLRIETTGMGGGQTVWDGKDVWAVFAMPKGYNKRAVRDGMIGEIQQSPAAALIPGSPLRKVKSAKLLGEESLEISGERRPCHLLQVDFEQPSTPMKAEETTRYWIDKQHLLVLKVVSEHRFAEFPPLGGPATSSTSLVAQSLKVNVTLPAEFFVFKPPKDAKEVEHADRHRHPQSSNMVGRPAPEFTLRDLENKEVQLKHFRGKVVLLDFWTTWCAPCRAEIPLLERIHRENKEVAVLAINIGEDAEKVRSYVQENKISFPVLLAGDGSIASDYGVNQFPTVYVLDKNGVTRFQEIGYGDHSDRQLSAAIAAARNPIAPLTAGSTFDGPVERIGPGVSVPQPISRKEPEYTEEARRAKISGAVLLELVLTPEGVPANIQVARGLGYGLDEKAVAAVSKWRFKPAMKDGKPVAVQMKIETNFRLLDGPPSPSVGVLTAETSPDTPEEAFRRAIHLMRSQRREEAIAMIGRAIEMRPRWALALATRGRMFYDAKRYSESISDYARAIDLGPANGFWYGSRGLAYSYSGQHALAIPDYTKAIELHPDSGGHYNDRGWAYSELGELDKALADLNKAIELAPDHQKAYENRGVLHHKRKEFARAIEDFTAAMQLNSTAWQFHRRAEARRASGDTTGADLDMQSAAKLGGYSHP